MSMTDSLRSPSSIPNRPGFKFVAVLKDGTKVQEEVVRDSVGCHILKNTKGRPQGLDHPLRRKEVPKVKIGTSFTFLVGSLDIFRVQALYRGMDIKNTWTTKAPFLVNNKWTWVTWTHQHGNKHAAMNEKGLELKALAWDYGQAIHEESSQFPHHTH